MTIRTQLECVALAFSQAATWTTGVSNSSHRLPLKQFASSAFPVPEPVVLEPALVGPGPGTGVATAITARHLHGTDVWLASQVDNFSATRHLPKCALGLAEP